MTPEQLKAKGLRVKELEWDVVHVGGQPSWVSDGFWIHENDQGLWSMGLGNETIGDRYPFHCEAVYAADEHNRARVLAALVEVG